MSGPNGAGQSVSAAGNNTFTGFQSWQGGSAMKVTQQTNAYTILASDYLVVFTGAGGVNCTLPGSPVTGQQHVIKNRTAGIITVVGTVDSVVNPTVAAGASLYLFWSGTEWINGT